jgi:hypothetical protein
MRLGNGVWIGPVSLAPTQRRVLLRNICFPGGRCPEGGLYAANIISGQKKEQSLVIHVPYSVSIRFLISHLL